MEENNVNQTVIKPVSQETLSIFDNVVSSVEDDVVNQCLADGILQRIMGAEACNIIKNGLGFVSKMLRAMMAFGAENIIDDQLKWAETRLPVNGISTKMVLDNFERYTKALEIKLPAEAFKEVQPYLAGMIRKQKIIVGNHDGN